MAHLTGKSAYAHLSERLNRFPQGAPPTELLFKILRVLFSETDAALVAQLPIRPFDAKKAASIWKKSEAESRRILENLAERAILLDMVSPGGETTYVLPPPMAGFFEFSLMRVRGDIDQKVLSELFYQYITVEEDFMRSLLLDGDTPMGRIFVNERALLGAGEAATSDEGPYAGLSLQVLDYERSSHVVETAEHLGISMCYCRHKKQHLGKACNAPMDICMTFGNTADSLIRHGHARRVDRVEGRELLAKALDHNLVQFGENVREDVAYICNCCGCCCEAMIGMRKFGAMMPVHSTNYIPRVIDEACNGCSKCVNICPVEAMSLVSAHDPHKHNRRKAKLDEGPCLGCGVCVRVCASNALVLEARPERLLTPLNTAHRLVMMAVERGQLQNLIFDNEALLSHRIMGAVLGAILKLSPIQRALATQQVKSVYLERLVAKAGV